MLDQRYEAYVARIGDGPSKTRGIALGEAVASALLADRLNDGRESNPQPGDLNPPSPGPGVWEPGSAAALGLRLPGMRPLALGSAAQFRPNGPDPVTSAAYAEDFRRSGALWTRR